MIMIMMIRDKSGTRLENIAAYNYKEAFVIDPRNGRISIKEKLSYASAAIIILTVQVRDKNAEDLVAEQVDTAEVTLYIKVSHDMIMMVMILMIIMTMTSKSDNNNDIDKFIDTDNNDDNDYDSDNDNDNFNDDDNDDDSLKKGLQC